MDVDTYTYVLLFCLTVSAWILLGGAMKANAGQSTWATKGMAFSGIVLALLGSIGFVEAVFYESPYAPDQDWRWFVLAGAGIVYGIAAVGFCARYGATRKRIIQLEEMESVLSAAVAHSAEQAQKREERL